MLLKLPLSSGVRGNTLEMIQITDLLEKAVSFPSECGEFMICDFHRPFICGENEIREQSDPSGLTWPSRSRARSTPPPSLPLCMKAPGAPQVHAEVEGATCIDLELPLEENVFSGKDKRETKVKIKN